MENALEALAKINREMREEKVATFKSSVETDPKTVYEDLKRALTQLENFYASSPALTRAQWTHLDAISGALRAWL